MKSRLDILKELDIRCGQLDRRRSLHRLTEEKNHFRIMEQDVRFCICAIIFVAVFINLPKTADLEPQIKKFIYNNNGYGTYSFEFQTLDGTFRKEDGGITKNVIDGDGFIVRGEYGYTDPEGHQHIVRYVADANGYQPQPDDIRFNDRRVI